MLLYILQISAVDNLVDSRIRRTDYSQKEFKGIFSNKGCTRIDAKHFMELTNRIDCHLKCFIII